MTAAILLTLHRGLVVSTIALLFACCVGLVVVLRSTRLDLGGGERPQVGALLALFAVALTLRAFCSLAEDGSPYDLGSYRILGDTLRHGGDIFTTPALMRQNYPPVLAWWAAAVTSIVPVQQPHRYAALFKLPFWLVDSGMAPLIVRWIPGRHALRAGWLYALNPLAISISAVSGQPDILVLLPLVYASVVIAESEPGAALLVGLAAALKPWPAFFMPALLCRTQWRRSTPSSIRLMCLRECRESSATPARQPGWEPGGSCFPFCIACILPIWGLQSDSSTTSRACACWRRRFWRGAGGSVQWNR
jgi:hypothetical protein